MRSRSSEIREHMETRHRPMSPKTNTRDVERAHWLHHMRGEADHDHPKSEVGAGPMDLTVVERETADGPQ